MKQETYPPTQAGADPHYLDDEVVAGAVEQLEDAIGDDGMIESISSDRFTSGNKTDNITVHLHGGAAKKQVYGLASVIKKATETGFVELMLVDGFCDRLVFVPADGSRGASPGSNTPTVRIDLARERVFFDGVEQEIPNDQFNESVLYLARRACDGHIEIEYAN